MVDEPTGLAVPESAGRAGDEGLDGRRQPSQAVVIIHGMGEQRPMATLRSLVEAVWNSDLALTPDWSSKRTTDPVTGRRINRSWIVPDRRTGSHEQRRITTVADIHGRRVDFYELYWADLTRDNTLGHLVGWVRGLLFRRWKSVPHDARPLYVALWIVTALAILPSAYLWLAALLSRDGSIPAAAGWTAVAALVAFVVTNWVLPVYGDVATYVQTEPGTVGKRAEVRARGVALLSRLMRDKSYDRIVVVGHSLGSIIAYDLLQILWTTHGPSHRNPRTEPEVTQALKAFDAYASPALLEPGQDTPREDQRLPEADLSAFREAQWRLYRALRSAPKDRLPWKISDFVTLGSPLTHAEFLVARDAGKWRKGVEERVFSVCPPISDSETRRTIVYRDRHAHHAAVFAATRWTNVFDTGNGWSTGDPFSGPMGENFYGGTKEYRVRLRWKLFGIWSRLMTHTHYWSREARGEEVDIHGNPTGRDHVAVLREAVDLQRRQDPAP